MLVSWGMLNLTHRYSHEKPTPIKPDETYELSFLLNMVGYTLPAGHRWRLTLAPSYWPHAWPSPQKATLSVYTGPSSSLQLPLRLPIAGDEVLSPFAEPEAAPPLPVEVRRAGEFNVNHEEDVATGRLTRTVHQDAGAIYHTSAELLYDQQSWDIMQIIPDDPLSALTHCKQQLAMQRKGQFSILIACDSKMWSDETNFYTHSMIEVTLDGQTFFQRDWDFSVKRDLV